MTKTVMQMTDPVVRRHKARRIRACTRGEFNISQACEKHKVSRSYGYRLIADLEAWEASATPEQELEEVHAAMRRYNLNPADPLKWLFVSGKLLTAYARGEWTPGQDDIGAEPYDELLE